MKLTDLTQDQAQMLLDCAPTTCYVIVVPCDNCAASAPVDAWKLRQEDE